MMICPCWWVKYSPIFELIQYSWPQVAQAKGASGQRSCQGRPPDLLWPFLRLQARAQGCLQAAEAHVGVRTPPFSQLRGQERRGEERAEAGCTGQAAPVCALGWAGLRACVSPSLPATLPKSLSREKATFKVLSLELLHAKHCLDTL